MAGLLTRLKGLFGRAEGSYTPAFGMSELGNWWQLNELDGTGWQRNLAVPAGSARNVAMVYACVMLYARAISQCASKHMLDDDKDGAKASTTSPASRVLRYPNDYETWAQFVYNVVAEMLFEGESLALKVRDDRNAVVALHRLSRREWTLHIEPETREVFYGINQPDMYAAPQMLVPMREVVHFRQHCPRHPLVGESPVKAAAMAVGITVALNASQLFFFSQMNRPSGVLTTDEKLTKDQIQQLREAFNAQSKLWAQGGTPILASGLKWQGLNITQADSQLVEQQKLSGLDIMRVFGVPSALLAESTGPMSGTEALISHWLSVGLGSVIESLERSLDRAFDLPASQHIQLDPTPLLRVDFAARIEGLVKGVQGGLLTPNEARKREGFGEVQGGNEAFLQRQMTPVSLLNQLNAADLASKLNPAEPTLTPTPASEDDEDDEDETRGLRLVHTGVKQEGRVYKDGEMFIDGGSTFLVQDGRPVMLAQRGRDGKVDKALIRQVLKEVLEEAP